MNPMGFKFFGNLNRVFVIYFLCVIISLRKTDAFAINNVDGRN